MKSIEVSEELVINFDYLWLDVKNEEDWIEAPNYINKNYGQPDILVNNAGITGFL